jgi:predicted DNA-binding transcriptional regulator AlpA
LRPKLLIFPPGSSASSVPSIPPTSWHPPPGPGAVAELLGCPNDSALFTVAFGSAIAAIGSLLAIIDGSDGQARRGLKEWSTTQELCEWLGIEVPALRWLHQCGEGPQRYRIGKENRFRRAEVEAWLDTRTAGDLVDSEPGRRRR